MTQMIINGTYLPQISGDRYACWEDLLGENVTMISGRAVFEVRGKIWRARAAFDWIPADTYTALLSVLRSGKAFSASVLPDNGEEMVASTFLVESMTPATFAFEDGEAVWRGLSFQIREVNPHA